MTDYVSPIVGIGTTIGGPKSPSSGSNDPDVHLNRFQFGRLGGAGDEEAAGEGAAGVGEAVAGGDAVAELAPVVAAAALA